MNANLIDRVAVLGLGTMGHGIAQVLAAAGCTVRGYDEVLAARDSTLTRIRGNLKQMAEAGIVAWSDIDSIVNRVVVCDSEQKAVEQAQFVIEAVREHLPTKQELFARIEPWVPAETILASNTSTFTITRIAERMNDPERAVIAHWFNPPHIVPVVEVVPGKKTSEQTMQTTLAFMTRAGKVAVRLNQELPGFIVNRVQAAMIREVWSLFDRGVASAEDIDRAVQGSLGFRLAAIGPLQVCDFGGLDIWRRVYEELVVDIKSDTTLPERIRKIMDAGHLGVKSGRGIYKYSPQAVEEKRTMRDERFLALIKLFYSASGSRRL